MASFALDVWKDHLICISLSDLCFEDRSINCSNFSGGANYRSKIHGELSRTANYCSKIHADQNNRHHKNPGKFHRNIVSSKNASEFRRNSFALLLHNTVTLAFRAGYEQSNLKVGLISAFDRHTSLKVGLISAFDRHTSINRSISADHALAHALEFGGE